MATARHAPGRALIAAATVLALALCCARAGLAVEARADSAMFYARQGPPAPRAPEGVGQVWHGNEIVLTLAADVAGLSAYERARIVVEERLVPWLEGGLLQRGSEIRVGVLEGRWVIFVDWEPPYLPAPENVLVTVDPDSAAFHNTPPRQLAVHWRTRLAGYLDFPVTGTIIEMLTRAGRFKYLLAILEATNLTESLHTEEPLTVFAPLDEVFARLSEEFREELLSDLPRLQAILLSHVAVGHYYSDELVTMQRLPTASGLSLEIQPGDPLLVQGARLLNADVKATNGVIHVVDQLLLPD